MKYLLIGSFRKISLEEQYFKNLLILGNEVYRYNLWNEFKSTLIYRLGNRLLNFDENNKHHENKILMYAKRIKPDIILVFKGGQIAPEILYSLKSHCKVLANYNPDHPFYFDTQTKESDNIKNSIKIYDIYLHYSTNVVNKLSKDFNIASYRIPFGYDENWYKYYDIEKNHFNFIGAYDGNRSHLIEYLLRKDIEVDIYGNIDWLIRNIRNKQILKNYKFRMLKGISYSKEISTSLGVLNNLRKQNIIENSHNMRTFEVPGLGGQGRRIKF